ncbi:MAG: ligase-associated DNA damage response endonuclease PdeM [Lunatimonas sp.]|uniref:ligase-associated DNA damage response endonuclease PdeM n=1 Tax=Lunatimonas sp. TaxID=2060141 RepID=UPI00263AC54D|nr:ligase-associated DNA damage response endonuclease PdeM [Lunatimonas sp.]MCC5936888.1 ligase-associated DNA damage response endonuclease PdeM [Lunatimonas sp.]
MHLQIGDIRLELLKEKAIWIASLGSLLLSDIHFGKAGHFRKAGIPISESVHEADYRVLEQLLATYQPKQVFFLGDLFHSEWNSQWDVLETFLKQFPETVFHLVRGNHDILPDAVYQSSVLQVHSGSFALESILLNHEPLPELPSQPIQICGHIHPGVTLRGKGRQRLKIPCFLFRKNTLVMPAFGAFTGLFNLLPEPEDRVYLVTPTKVIPMNLEDRVGLVASAR